MRVAFPFSAIVGPDEMKRAILLTAVDPTIGGVLILGDWVTDVFTKGGIYTAWPILTTFVFSFIHGAFASNLLSYLGIEAKKH